MKAELWVSLVCIRYNYTKNPLDKFSMESVFEPSSADPLQDQDKVIITTADVLAPNNFE